MSGLATRSESSRDGDEDYFLAFPFFRGIVGGGHGTGGGVICVDRGPSAKGLDDFSPPRVGCVVQFKTYSNFTSSGNLSPTARLMLDIVVRDVRASTTDVETMYSGISQDQNRHSR